MTDKEKANELSVEIAQEHDSKDVVGYKKHNGIAINQHNKQPKINKICTKILKIEK